MALSPQLAAEIDAPPAWMFDWDLGAGVRPPLISEHLPLIHRTRLEMFEAPVRAALAAAGPDARAADLACNEGWFSQRLLDLGAAEVLGLDIRDVLVRRAALVRDHLGISAERLRFAEGDVLDATPAQHGTFDVVLVLGLVYHMEDPVGAVRRAFDLTRPGGLVVVESQLTRNDDEVEYGWGVAGAYERTRGNFAVRFEHDQADNPLASSGGVISLVPSRTALALMLEAAGFTEIAFCAASAERGHDAQYVDGDRAVVTGRRPA